VKRARRPSEEERERIAPEAERAPVHPLLELQRGAGNRAVSTMIARDAKEKEKEEATGTRATLPGVGVVPLESVQFDRGTGRPKRGREDREKDKSGELSLTSKVGEHSQKLFKESLGGRPMEVEIVVVGSEGTMRLTLKGALISSFRVSEEFESWTLSFEEMEHRFEGE
jgi:hypothetical protein